ncbi:hypothetical protein ASPCAL04970 [Aspergillus calidoustus]|uniref:N-acetyltransferase domain-containing protein n=1 Tax=Aspergillus calidoustus TaxID=454130 RepID=A0A0U5FWZ7_ASPCI|nr:hypothetical protein ASPCAL04970 [Aspergillus calidoustus]
MTETKSENEAQPVPEPEFFPRQPPRVIIPTELGTIRTRRLILRPLALSDAEDIFEHRRLQAVADWLINPIPDNTVDDTREYIKEQIFTTPDASGATGRMFSYAILLADDPTEKVIGALGIHALVPAPVIWYHTHPYSWGQGFASEALGAVLDAWWKLPRSNTEKDREEARTEKVFAGPFKEINLLGRDAMLLAAERPNDELV